MRKIVLFIAMSLDGYIADSHGGVAWLGGQDPEAETLDTYSPFVENVDTVIMGWNTYHQVVTELSPEEWVYEALQSYVITHREVPSTDNITFTAKSPCDLVRELRLADGKDIWICGGASIIQELVREDLIDEYYLSVIPTLLGGGIRLFDRDTQEIPLKLLRTQSYNGITDLVYTKR